MVTREGGPSSDGAEGLGLVEGWIACSTFLASHNHPSPTPSSPFLPTPDPLLPYASSSSTDRPHPTVMSSQTYKPAHPVLERSQSTFSPSIKETEGGFPFNAVTPSSTEEETRQALEDAVLEYEAKRDR